MAGANSPLAQIDFNDGILVECAYGNASQVTSKVPVRVEESELCDFVSV